MSGISKEEGSLNPIRALDHCKKLLVKEDGPRLMWSAPCLVSILKHIMSFDSIYENLFIFFLLSYQDLKARMRLFPLNLICRKRSGRF